jgi:hypothetical protein
MLKRAKRVADREVNTSARGVQYTTAAYSLESEEKSHMNSFFVVALFQVSNSCVQTEARIRDS